MSACLAQSSRPLDLLCKQIHQIVVGPHIGDFEVVDAALEPRESVAHLPDQIEDFQSGGFAL